MAEFLRQIKKYPNRRLYDARTSSYITLSDIKNFVRNAEGFKVVDAKTGEDLTRNVLLQIISNEEELQAPLFSTQFLLRLIPYHGHPMRSMLGQYLEASIDCFAEFQMNENREVGTMESDRSLLSADPQGVGRTSRFPEIKARSIHPATASQDSSED